MINWFREKLSEKRSRWRKQQNPAVSDSRDCPQTSSVEKKQKLYAKNSSDDSILPKVSLKVINPRGGIVSICVSPEASGLEMKKEALRKLSDSNSWSHFSSEDENSGIWDKYKLIRAKTTKTLDDKDRVDEMKISENEEFVLVAGRTDQMKIINVEMHKGPSESEIMDATKDIPVQYVRSSPVNQINSAFMQNELQYDFRKILMALLKYSAIILGGSTSESNNQAEKLIKYYRQKLKLPALDMTGEFDKTTRKKTNIEALLQIIQTCSQSTISEASHETVQNMIEMGFDEDRVQQALQMTKNEAEACEFLLSTNNGFSDLPIIETLLSQPQIQYSLGNPKIFIAYISILENYWSLNSYLNDSETSSNITQILRIYHEEKHILAINQSNAEPT